VKDVQIRDQTRRVEVLEENCQDLEGTINQFRDLVLQLQRSGAFCLIMEETHNRHSSEVDSLRALTQTAQHESATAASQTAAMMSLNLKLQSNVSKNQARNIELEIKKLEAKETRELLNIVQVYLLDRRLGFSTCLIADAFSRIYPNSMLKVTVTPPVVTFSCNV
jgi:dynactin 1